MTHPMQLVPPSFERLPSYVAALKRGWSPDNIRGVAASIDELAQIENNRGAASGIQTLARLDWFQMAAGDVRIARSRTQ